MHFTIDQSYCSLSGAEYLLQKVLYASGGRTDGRGERARPKKTMKYVKGVSGGFADWDTKDGAF